MKTLKIVPVIAILFAIANTSFAQAKTQTLKVSGECGMCKKKIEKAAKEAGATFALWNTETKILTVKYNSSTTNTAKIQQKIAGVGYDTPDYKATEDAYDNLDDCCKYERTATAEKPACCKDDKCSKEGHSGKDCCKKSE